MQEHVFQIFGEWGGGLDGSGRLSLQDHEGQISVPKSLGGQGLGTNPEELLLAASTSCYLVSLAAILQYKKLPFNSIRIRSTATFLVNVGPSLKKIVHFPEVIVPHQVRETTLQSIRKCFDLAEKSCMVSTAIRGNAEVVVRGKFTQL